MNIGARAYIFPGWGWRGLNAAIDPDYNSAEFQTGGRYGRNTESD
jgi:hypothetical protein